MRADMHVLYARKLKVLLCVFGWPWPALESRMGATDTTLSAWCCGSVNAVRDAGLLELQEEEGSGGEAGRADARRADCRPE